MILLLLFLLFAGQAQASVLSDLVASMAPGSYQILVPNNTAAINLHYVNVYGDSMVWDPVTRKLLFAGSGHATAGYYVAYDEATNSYESPALWGIPPVPSTYTGSAKDIANEDWVMPGHSYDNNTYCNGKHYYRQTDVLNAFWVNPSTGGPQEWRVNPSTRVWETLPTNTVRRALGQASDGDGWACFPDVGGIVHAESFGKLWLFNTTTDTWSRFGPNTGATADLPNWTNPTSWTFIEYNPALREILVGNGASGQIWIVDSKRQITQKGNAPFTLYDGGGFTGNVTVDPVSGKYIFYTPHFNSGEPYKPTSYLYDSRNDTWTLNPNQPPDLPAPYRYGAITSTPVDTHGVTITFICDVYATECRGRLLVYKHASTNPDTLYTNKCTAPGVTRCWSFDDTSQFETNRYVFQMGGTVPPARDTTTKQAGASSLKFTMSPPTHAGQNDAGKWEPQGQNGDYALGQQFGYGTSFYVQFKARFDTNMWVNPWNVNRKFFEILWNNSGAGNGIACGDRIAKIFSCYTQQGQTVVGVAGPGGSITYGAVNSPYWIQTLKNPNRNCDYPEWATADHADCVFMVANQWMTFTVKVEHGNPGSANGRIVWWYSDETRKPQLLLDTGAIFPLAETHNGTTLNTLNFSSYMTGLATSVGPATASYQWIDSVVVSTLPIAMEPPLLASGDVTPPVVTITSPTSGTTYNTTSNTVNLAGTCTDNIACTSVSWVNDRGGSGTATLATGWNANNITLQVGANVLTVTGFDAAANSGNDILTVNYTPAAPSVNAIQLNSGGGEGIKLGDDGGLKIYQ